MLRRSETIEAERADYEWGTMYWLGNREIGNTDSLSMANMVMKPGAIGVSHHHPNCEEVLYLLKGRLEHHIGGDILVQEPGDFITIGANISHYAVNIADEDAELIIAFSSAAREFVTV
jgi:quercetin dioxygenase-like cupin family protein